METIYLRTIPRGWQPFKKKIYKDHLQSEQPNKTPQDPPAIKPSLIWPVIASTVTQPKRDEIQEELEQR